MHHRVYVLCHITTVRTHIDLNPAKRTRQNLVKMEERKRKREQSRQHKMQGLAAASEPRQAPLDVRHAQQKKGKKNSTLARRQRKEKQRARKAEGDAMDIG
jgi:hypothetical protein